jgi:hypothetical protein
MGRRSARFYVRQVLAGVFHRVFRRGYSYRVSCSRVSGPRFRCAVTFSSGPNDYYGHVIVFYFLGAGGKVYWSDSYTVRWVNNHCYFYSGHRRRCKVHVKRGSF